MELLSYLLGKKSGGGGADLSEYFQPTIDNNGFKYMVKKIPETTTVSGTDLSRAFYEYDGVSVPLLDTSGVTSMSGMFRYCKKITTIPLFDTSNVINMDYMFDNCSSLTTLPLLNTSSVTSMNKTFQVCPNLTDTSLDILLQMCINSNVTTTSKKKLSYIGLTAENYPVSKIQSLPHYQDLINAGWTIGY